MWIINDVFDWSRKKQFRFIAEALVFLPSTSFALRRRPTDSRFTKWQAYIFFFFSFLTCSVKTIYLKSYKVISSDCHLEYEPHFIDILIHCHMIFLSLLLTMGCFYCPSHFYFTTNNECELNEDKTTNLSSYALFLKTDSGIIWEF